MKKLILLLIIPLFLFAENWPGFRGPSHQGYSTEKNVQTVWDASTNIKWKIDAPGDGWSSPIVFDEAVYVSCTTDSGKACRLVKINLADGKIAWNVELFEQELKFMHPLNSHATPTPVTDGETVFAIFNDGSMAGVDVNGKLLWTNKDHKFYSQHGLGASPVLCKNMVIMPFDGSSQGPDKHVGWQSPWEKAYILALDLKSGKEIYRAKRGPSRIAHVTPNFMQVNGTTQLISAAGDVVQGFNPDTGELIWTSKRPGEGKVPSVVCGENLVYSTSGYGDPVIYATDPTGKGDVTETHIKWEQKENVPELSSFLLVEPYLYTVAEKGKAMCLDSQTGKILSEHRLRGKYSASPIYADGHIYFLSEQGKTSVFNADDTFTLVSENEIHDRCRASLAVSQGHIILKSEKYIFCIK